MNLRQLRYFQDTAQSQNLAETARKHMVPASSVSAAIRRLEEELGVELFDRSSNKTLCLVTSFLICFDVIPFSGVHVIHLTIC